MALRNQPYFPLYVQDYLTDEKLNSCCAASQGVYIKILCIFHKQETYGKVLFKQKDKQTDKQILNFALKFAKLLPFDTETILNALTELVEEGVLTIDGDEIYQKRMVKDGNISLLRSKAGKDGGGNPNLFKQSPKQTPKQNPEYEYTVGNEVNNEIDLALMEGDKNKKFNAFWELYDKKVGDKKKLIAKWLKLTDADRNAIMVYLPKYKLSQPDKQYRKNPETFLNNKSWNDEIIDGANNGKVTGSVRLFNQPIPKGTHDPQKSREIIAEAYPDLSPAEIDRKLLSNGLGL